MRFRIVLAYNGTSFHGWQRNPGVRTVQGELDRALTKMNGGVAIRSIGASRTDAGVHAEYQVAAFDYDGRIEAETWRRGLNALTGDDVTIRSVAAVPSDFHPRFDASGKHYRYLIWTAKRPPVHLYRRVWCSRSVDVDLMRAGARHLVGEHYFDAFRAKDCEANTSLRRIDEVSVSVLPWPWHYACHGERPAELIAIDVRGNAFLKYMVRIMTGTLYSVGRGEIAPDAMAGILAGRDRSLAGRTAPADGLTLLRIFFDAEGNLRPGWEKGSLTLSKE